MHQLTTTSKRLLHRSTVLTVALVTVAAVGLGAAGCRGRHDPARLRAHVARRLDKELDRLKVTPDQRARIHATRDRLFKVFEDNRKGRRAMLAEALQLFQSDSLPPARIEALRSEHEARSKLIHAEVLRAVTELHATLTPEQRRQLVERINAKLARWHR